MKSFEIEIKTLLGAKKNADALIRRMKKIYPKLESFGMHTQLNHYFEGGDLKVLAEKMKGHLPPDKQKELEKIIKKVKDYSLRSRNADGRVIFVMKLAVDDTSSSNGTARLELESPVALSLEELDQIFLDCSFKYLSKWSRERQEFKYKDYNVTVDKNAGYGYLAEFESILNHAGDAEVAKTNLRKAMAELGVEELNQERLARMFDYYNTHWEEYYGTDKVFNIE
jgi:predicted adenylyl cyclase CyaB